MKQVHILLHLLFVILSLKKEDSMRKKEGRIRHFFRDVKNLIREVIWEGIIQGFLSFLLNLILAIFRFILHLFK